MSIFLGDVSYEMEPSTGFHPFPSPLALGCLFYGSVMFISTSVFTGFVPSFASVSSFSFHQDRIHTVSTAHTIPLIHIR